MTPEFEQRARRVRLVIFDVDGVLTDGRLYFGADGEVLKAFDVRDGLGIKMLANQGLEVAIISGRRSAIVARRAAELGIRHLRQGVEDKGAAFEQLLAELGLAPEQAAHIGDDLIDLPVIRRAGLAIVPADADPFVAGHAHWCTRARGGRGAVREAAEAILEAQGRLAAERTRHLG